MTSTSDFGRDEGEVESDGDGERWNNPRVGRLRVAKLRRGAWRWSRCWGRCRLGRARRARRRQHREDREDHRERRDHSRAAPIVTSATRRPAPSSIPVGRGDEGIDRVASALVRSVCTGSSRVETCRFQRVASVGNVLFFSAAESAGA